MRMGVDQARHDGRLAQVFDRHVVRRAADGDDPALGMVTAASPSGGPATGKTQRARRLRVGIWEST